MVKIKTNRDFEKNRSDRYQHLLVESSCAPDILMEFSESRGITGYLNMLQYNEELSSLREELRQEMWRLMEEVLTKRQFQVIELLAQGHTQMEIAKMLGVNQSSITKSVNGNCDYRNGKRIYGGAKKKLRKAADEDPKIQEIIKKMEEIFEEVE